MTPKSNRRWMRSALQGVARAEIAMPWQRGPQRAAMLARRTNKTAAAQPMPRAIAAR